MHESAQGPYMTEYQLANYSANCDTSQREGVQCVSGNGLLTEFEHFHNVSGDNHDLIEGNQRWNIPNVVPSDGQLFNVQGHHDPTTKDMTLPSTGNPASGYGRNFVRDGPVTIGNSAAAYSHYQNPNTDGPALNWLPFDNEYNFAFDPTLREYVPHMTEWGRNVDITPNESQETIMTATNASEPLQGMRSHVAPATVPFVGATPTSTAISESSPHNDSVDETKHGYVAGGGSRRSIYKESKIRTRLASHIPSTQNPRSPDSSNSGCLLSDRAVSSPIDQRAEHLASSLPCHVHEKLQHLFDNRSDRCRAFLSDESFISMQNLQALVSLYFKGFDSVYPFIDHLQLASPTADVRLILAIASIGASYSTVTRLRRWAHTLHILLYEVLVQNYNLDESDTDLIYVQARALNCVGLCHSSDQGLYDLGFKIRNHLLGEINACKSILSRTNSHQKIPTSPPEWLEWRVAETQIRTISFIGMLQLILTYETDFDSRFISATLENVLPSPEALWHAETFESWQHEERNLCKIKTKLAPVPGLEYSSLYDQEMPTASLALEALHRKLLVPGMEPDFIRILLIHALIDWQFSTVSFFSRSFRNDRKLKARPVASYDPSKEQLETKISYGAAIPEIAHWRNMACDSLDTLHWDAMARSSASGGHEGPVFLNLNLARLVLLCPIREIQAFFFSQIQEKLTWKPSNGIAKVMEETQTNEQILLCWAIRDRYKARLAVLHASGIFWHIRRYSSKSFGEPFAVFLAALVLWTYGKYAPKLHSLMNLNQAYENAKPGSSPKSPASSRQPAEETNNRGAYPSSMKEMRNPDGDEDECSSRSDSPFPGPKSFPLVMNIDRPFDDELAQYFIRSGENIHAFMEGIGDICAPENSSKILKEGASLLRRRCKAWSISENYAAALDAAATM